MDDRTEQAPRIVASVTSTAGIKTIELHIKLVMPNLRTLRSICFTTQPAHYHVVVQSSRSQ